MPRMPLEFQTLQTKAKDFVGQIGRTSRRTAAVAASLRTLQRYLIRACPFLTAKPQTGPAKDFVGQIGRTSRAEQLLLRPLSGRCRDISLEHAPFSLLSPKRGHKAPSEAAVQLEQTTVLHREYLLEPCLAERQLFFATLRITRKIFPYGGGCRY